MPISRDDLPRLVQALQDFDAVLAAPTGPRAKELFGRFHAKAQYPYPMTAEQAFSADGVWAEAMGELLPRFQPSRRDNPVTGWGRQDLHDDIDASDELSEKLQHHLRQFHERLLGHTGQQWLMGSHQYLQNPGIKYELRQALDELVKVIEQELGVVWTVIEDAHDLARVTPKARVKGPQLAMVNLIQQQGGRATLADLRVVGEWDEYSENEHCWNGYQTRLNRKFRPLGWEFRLSGDEVVACRCAVPTKPKDIKRKAVARAKTGGRKRDGLATKNRRSG